MKNKTKLLKKITLVLLVMCLMTSFIGCELLEEQETDVDRQQTVTENLTDSQKTPTDVDYSLERYNLIRRTYWVNGQREKANALPCAVAKPLGYVVLFTDNGAVVGKFTVDGKVSSLNSFLTPNAVEEYYSNGATITTELADVDGSYGENDAGIFFFTPDGKYIEWTGTYLYSDIPFEISNPILKISE